MVNRYNSAEYARLKRQVEVLRDGLDIPLLSAALNAYHCRNQHTEDDESLPLVDALTPEWEESITVGKDEIEGIAEFVADYYSLYYKPQQALAESKGIEDADK